MGKQTIIQKPIFKDEKEIFRNFLAKMIYKYGKVQDFERQGLTE